MFLNFQIIDPFVEVEIIGLNNDCSKQQTRVVDDNGICEHSNSGQAAPSLCFSVRVTSLLSSLRFQPDVGGDPRLQYSDATDRPGAFPGVGSRSHWAKFHWTEDCGFLKYDARYMT